MQLKTSDIEISSQSDAARQINNLLNKPSYSIVSRMNAINAIINASGLTVDDLDKSSSPFVSEIAELQAFVRENDVQSYIKSHIDSVIFPINSVILEIYRVAQGPKSIELQSGNNSVVGEILG